MNTPVEACQGFMPLHAYAWVLFVMAHAGFLKGLGKIILSMLIEELFNRGAKLIFLDTNLKNKRAKHVYEALGFKKMAVNIDSWKNQLGELQSSVDYELVREDFNNFNSKRS